MGDHAIKQDVLANVRLSLNRIETPAVEEGEVWPLIAERLIQGVSALIIHPHPATASAGELGNFQNNAIMCGGTS